MFTFKNIILSGVLVLLLASVVLQAYNMYTLSNAAATGTDFWKTNKVTFYIPPVVNLVGMAFVGVLFVMG